MFPKDNPWRSRKYLEWVKSLPSVVSRIEPAGDAHHPKGHGFGGTVKCSDAFAIPVTRGEHTDFHNMTVEEWENKHGSQLVHALKTINRALSEGVLK